MGSSLVRYQEVPDSRPALFLCSTKLICLQFQPTTCHFSFDGQTPSSWAIFSSLIFTGSVYYFLVTSQITLPSTETKPPVDEWRVLVTTSPGPGQFAINNKPIDSSKNSSSPGKYFRNYISFLNEEVSSFLLPFSRLNLGYSSKCTQIVAFKGKLYLCVCVCF